MNLRPDPTFHATPKLAMEAPAETLAFTLMLSPDGAQPDGLAVVDVNPASDTYGQILHQVIMPNTGDEFHHFGWNACSSALSPLTGHAFLERRYLIVPGIRSSRIYVIDVKEPLKAKIHKIIEPKKFSQRPDIHALIRYIADRKAFMSRRLAAVAKTEPTGRRASLSWIVKLSRFWADMKWTGVNRTSTMISGGTCPATIW